MPQKRPARKRSGIFHQIPLLAICGLLFAFTRGASAAAERQVLRGHVPAAVAGMQPVGRLPAEQRLRLAIGLPLRNQPELNALLQQLYEPTSPSYRRYLTPAQFAEQFGPAETDYQTVAEFAKANNLTVTATYPNRVVLDIQGTVADIEKAFHVTLRVYRHPRENRDFYAPDTEPSVDIGVRILHVSGLDTYSLPHPNSKMKPLDGLVNRRPNAGSGPNGSYRGADFRAAYAPGVTSLTGAGQTVGLLQFDGFYASDIATYASQAGLPTVPLTVVPVDGGVSSPGSGNSEVCLDIEMVMSMAPGVANIYVFEAPNPSPWVDLLNAMANHDPLPMQLSCSWGGGPPDPTAEGIFQQMAAQGQSFFNATGDSDAFSDAIEFPSESPNITEVGGTTLTTGAGAAYESETVWNWGFEKGNYVGSSGGVSTYYSIPFYQEGISMVANQGSTTMRNVPDVALTADNVYVVYGNGRTGAFGGTSCAAPLWAGFMALVNEQAAANGRPSAGFINPAVYTLAKGPNYSACFHDTTVGNNFTRSSPARFEATSGYDLCTGWGTPTGSNLINALTLAPTVGFTASPLSGAPPLTVSFTNLSSGAESYVWTFGDGKTSTAANPVNIYSNAGNYSIALTAAGVGGSTTFTRTNYVVVSNAVIALTFVGGPTTGTAPLIVSFTNLSSGFSGYSWAFGDGNVSANLNPANTYSNAGSYSVTLSGVGVGSTNSFTRTNYIVVVTPPPVLSFVGGPTTGTAPLRVTFMNLTTGATNFSWAFGDGTVSADANPVNTYSNGGKYSVTLTAVGAGGTNSLTRTNYITAIVPVVSAFSGSPTNGVAPLTVTFTNLSTGATNVLWAFGDGTTSANGNPSNTYSNVGAYSVTLTASGAGGIKVLSRTNYIVVLAAPPVADFTAEPTNGAAPLAVVFSNLSLGATDCAWDFGDGGFSAELHPVHTYTNPGSYSVRLVAVGSGGSNSLIRTNYVVVFATPSASELLLIEPLLLPDGGFRFALSNLDGSAVMPEQQSRIEVYGADDLAFPLTNWLPLSLSSRLTNGVLELTDPDAGFSRQRFYRALQRP
jgi:PKD repeat protein